MKRGLLIIFTILLAIAAAGYFSFISAPGSDSTSQRFVVSLGEGRSAAIRDIINQGFAKNDIGLEIAMAFYGFPNITPGGYKISKNMNVFDIISVLKAGPYMKWVVVPEGLRKEEVGALLAQNLGWNSETENEFLDAYKTSGGNDYKEGVYFPSTYLLPLSENGTQIAQRFITEFNESFAPYAKEAAKENIKWTTALKVASIIQREAADASDMTLISGIIWNRLLKNMPLDIDATVEYARGDTGNGYWAPLTAGDLKIDSPYNTYLHKGLPPTPIANPGISAISAALNPETTTCFYYLHDSNKNIHCADTYAGQEANIQKYLK